MNFSNDFIILKSIKTIIMVRCIHYANESGSREGVYFTEDTDMDAQDVIPPGCTLNKDFEIDDDLPGDFPLDTALEKRI
jgi:hypothetical protein